MRNEKLLKWILRIAVAGEFVGHGVFAVQGKKQWVGWIQQFTGADAALAAQLLWFVGITDIALAILVLLRPVRLALLWMAVWGFWTALVRPLVGEPVWDFVERWANWGAPLALLIVVGWPKTLKEWFS
ncbi:hypothetical protein HYW68_01155 [Candidatus Parcubacteria bacterium]|nr:hypothetical protein [Candidatus Parcubacteria bacterium]